MHASKDMRDMSEGSRIGREIRGADIRACKYASRM